MGCLCRHFHMLCDRQFKYTLVLLYILCQDSTSIETRNVRFFTFVFSVKGMISVILKLVVAVYQQILSNIEQGFIGLFRGNQTFITMFPPIVCLLTRYPCHCHSHTMNNSWVYVIYMSTTWNSTQVAYLCLSLLTCRHWLFERWIVLSTE